MVKNINVLSAQNLLFVFVFMKESQVSQKFQGNVPPLSFSAPQRQQLLKVRNLKKPQKSGYKLEFLNLKKVMINRQTGIEIQN